MTYEELERRYFEQSAALGSQRSANKSLKEHNERLRKKVAELEARLLISRIDGPAECAAGAPIDIAFYNPN